MSARWTAITDALGDRVNPIVVKELRQAVKGRFLPALLVLLLAAQVIAFGFQILGQTSSFDVMGGGAPSQGFFAAVVSLLLLASVLFIPAFAGVRIALERSDENLDLLFVSTLKPSRIVSGKLFANLILVLLLYSACLPFLSFTYFLRGIDLISIVLVLGMDFLIAIGAIQGAIFLGCLPASRWFKVLIAIGALIGLIVAYNLSLFASLALPSEGVGSRVGDLEFWIAAGVFVAFLGLAIGLFFVLSTALIAAPVANRALPVRTFVTAGWAVTGAMATFSALESGSSDVLEGWIVLVTAVVAVAVLLAVSGRDRPSRRVASEIPNQGWRRVLAFPFWSGSANGLTWAVGLVVLTVASNGAVRALAGIDLGDALLRLVGLFSSVVAYALAGLHIHRRWLRRRVPVGQTWAVAVGLIGLGSLVPPMLIVLIAPGSAGSGAVWTMFNPFVFLDSQVDEPAFAIATTGAAVMAALSWRWFWAQVRVFRPPVTSDEPTAPGT